MRIGPETICREGWEPEDSKRRIKESSQAKWEERAKRLETEIKNLSEEEKKQRRDEFEELKRISTENGGVLEMHKWDEEKKTRFNELAGKFKEIF